MMQACPPAFSCSQTCPAAALSANPPTRSRYHVPLPGISAALIWGEYDPSSSWLEPLIFDQAPAASPSFGNEPSWIITPPPVAFGDGADDSGGGASSAT